MNSVWMNFWATSRYSWWLWRNKLVHDDAFAMPLNPCTKIKRKIHYYDVSFPHSLLLRPFSICVYFSLVILFFYFCRSFFSLKFREIYIQLGEGGEGENPNPQYTN